MIECVILDIAQLIAQPPSDAVELRSDPRRYALCFPLDLNLTSQSVDLVGLPVSTPRPEVGFTFLA